MGVQGLWDLLAPVGRRVSVETLSGKKLAIDASIWMVQFMKAMRDVNGDMVRNAHLLGFFRRICKLLYLRTKPVFVFDGGTPALKRRTVIARRRQRENAQAKIRKTAEKLLLNQLKTARLKELAKDLENQRQTQRNDSMGKKCASEQMAQEPRSVETGDTAFDSSNLEKLDKMLAASIAVEEDGRLKNAATSAGLGGKDDGYEDIILPEIDGDLDPDVLAALPPSMQRKVLMKMRSVEDRKVREGAKIENNKKNEKGKELLSDPAAPEDNNSEALDENQKKLDEMLAASILAKEDESQKYASTSSASAPFEEGYENDDDEEMILPTVSGNVDPAVLAALPPSMQLDLLGQMRERLMAENRQRYQKVKKIENNKKNEKGKELLSDPAAPEGNNSEALDETMESFNQKKLDEMLAASILAEEEASQKYTSTSSASAPFEEGGEKDDDEEMILPTVSGNVDPAVLAALPPSMQLDLLVQMRERLMAENRQQYQKVKKAPKKFSELQIQAYLKTVAFRREIDQVQKAAAGKGVGGFQTSRIASEANREFIFSSAFTGDKQSLTSGGVLGTGDKQPQAPRGVLSDSVCGDSSASNSIMTGLVLEKSGNVFDDDGVETYTDERGRIRVNRMRAMGIRMTRDLQRNLDLMKETEQDASGFANAHSKSKEKGTSSGEFTASKRQEVRSLDDSNVGSTRLDDRNGATMIDNDSTLQISFEIGDKSFESDDDMFSHLVAAQPVDISYADNDTSRGQGPDSASDSDWEEGTITKKIDGSSADPELLNKSFIKASSGTDDSEVEWEEGPSDFNDSFLCQVASGKPASRGQLEEDNDLQEAIRRSLMDIGSDKGCTEYQDLEVNNPQEYRLDLNMVRKDIQENKMKSGPLEANKLVGQSQTKEANEFPPSGKTGMRKLDGFRKSVSEYPGSRFEEHQHDTHKEQKINVEEPYGYAEESIDAFTEACGLSTSIGLCPTDNAHISKPDPIHSIMSDGVDTVEKEASMCVREGKVSPETGSSFDSVKEAIAGSSVTLVQSPGSDLRVPVNVMEQTGEAKIPDAQSALRDTSNYGTAVTANNDNTFAQASLDNEIHILGQEFMNLEDEQRKHERNAESVTSEMFAECQELLQMFGVPYIIAPMEAEAQCAYMELAGLVDGVVTDDSDVLLFGACSVYKNIFDDRKYVETYFMKDIEKELGLTREKLIRMALLLGSDYTEGVSGIGIVNAIEVVNAFPEENGLQKFRDWIESPDPTILGSLNGKPNTANRKLGSKVGESNSGPSDKSTTPMDEKKKSADETQEIKQIFMDKHRNVSKNWYIPSTFPSEAVISAYWSPQVDKSAEPFTWGKPDHRLLQRFCWERFGWNIQKSDDLLLPVLKEYNKRETQLRLEAFYTFNERFAKIRSKRIKKAVKGIAGKQNSVLLDDVRVELPENSKKKRVRSAESEAEKSSNITEGHDLSSDRNLSGKVTTKRYKKGRSTGTSEMDSPGQEFWSEERQKTVNGSNKGGRGRSNGVRKGNEIRGKGRGRGRGRGRGSRGLGESDHSTSNTDNSNDEQEDHIQNSERPKDLRRSKRLREHVSYAADLDVTESVDMDCEREAGKAEKNRQNGDSSVTAREGQNLEDQSLVNDTNGDHLETGGGFCVDEGEASELEAGENCDPLEGNASLDYLASGGGFCVDETGVRDDQGYTGMLPTAFAEGMTENSCQDGLMNEVEFTDVLAQAKIPSTTGALNGSLVDAGNAVKDQNNLPVGSGQSEDDSKRSSAAFHESDGVASEVGGLTAMPFLKRKRKKD